MDVVVDASLGVEVLLRTPIGRAAAEQLEVADVFAPELLDVEVVSVLRRLARGGRVSDRRCGEALSDLRVWPIQRISHGELVLAAWRHRHNLTAYDAFYVAAAEILGAQVWTIDGPLARAPGLGSPVRNLRG